MVLRVLDCPAAAVTNGKGDISLLLQIAENSSPLAPCMHLATAVSSTDLKVKRMIALSVNAYEKNIPVLNIISRVPTILQ